MPVLPQKFTHQDVVIEQTESLYQGFFKMVRYQVKHRLYEGGWSDSVQREIFERGHAVAVLPYDPNTGEFVLIEQFRVGAIETSSTPWLIEVIAGVIDEGETEEGVCIREAEEEAGLHITNLHKACSYLASPGGTTERIHIFMAKVNAAQASGVHGLDSESEDILVHRVSEQQAKVWLEEGIIDNAAAIIALQWFFMNKNILLTKWNGSEK
ncbi:ADP-ribose diphosphatase [Alteromonas sediminis]|uniref:ADP-ribose diphosphatase n=1 Tax=Alteromonas sediminis TaxID=2259342 RepID=UPI00196A2CB4|nr:ADP-ribose diphosphatase [Alteromonas sediminis]